MSWKFNIPTISVALKIGRSSVAIIWMDKASIQYAQCYNTRTSTQAHNRRMVQLELNTIHTTRSALLGFHFLLHLKLPAIIQVR